MELDIPPPTSANLSTTLIPISYQFIYRPVLLAEYFPIYLGGGIGYLGASFNGSAIELIEQQGISFDNSTSGPTGYAFIGAELLQWDQNFSLTFGGETDTQNSRDNWHNTTRSDFRRHCNRLRCQNATLENGIVGTCRCEFETPPLARIRGVRSP